MGPIPRSTRRLPVILCIAMLGACAIKNPTPQPSAKILDNYSFIKQKLNWLIGRELDQEKISGISIALIEGESLIWQDGFGYADTSKKVVATAQTRYRAGSLIKPLNAIALLRLQEQHKLDITTPIQAYLPEFLPPSRFTNSKAITAQHCLSHLSGLPSDLIKGMWTQEPEHFSSTLAYLNNGYLAAPPDTVFRYSNLAHNLLAAVIEKQSQQEYTQHMRALFSSVGMHTTDLAARADQVAKAYDKNKPRDVFNLRDVPAAGLLTSAEDLARLLIAFNRIDAQTENAILSEDSWRQMLADYSGELPLNLGKRHGLGLIFYDGLFHSTLTVFGHGGASVNHRALIKFIPQEGVGVALLSNSKNSSASLHKIANEALSLLLQAKHGKPAPKNTAYWPQAEAQDIVEPKRLVGHYATAGGMAKIYKHDKGYKVNIAGRSINLYQRESQGLFYLRYKLFGLWPIDLGYFSHLAFALRDINGKEYLISKNTRGREAMVGPKISPIEVSEAWRRRVGKYRVVNPLDAIDLPSGGLRIEDGFLVAYATTEDGDKLSVVLNPINDQEAIVSGLGRGLGETVRVVVEEGKELLYFSGLYFSKR